VTGQTGQSDETHSPEECASVVVSRISPAASSIEVVCTVAISCRPTRRLIDFCGLDWDDACLRPETNRRSVKSASAWQVRQPTYSSFTGRWRHYEPWLGDQRQLLKPEAAAPLPGASMVGAASD
jgi:hypothetical protein